MRWILLALVLLTVGCHVKFEGRKTSCNCAPPPATNGNAQAQCRKIEDEESRKICIEAVEKATQDKH